MIYGLRSIALLPFWCLDAKGGEAALVGLRGDLLGFGHKLESLSFICSLCPFHLLSFELFARVCF